MRKSVITLLLLTIVFSANAQQKIGCFDVNYVIPQLPEAKLAQKELQTYATKLDEDLRNKQKEFKTKYDTYLKDGTSMPEPSRVAYEKELQTMQKQLAEFEQNAQKSIQEKQAKLMSPIYEKVEKVLKQVAKENGFTYILRKETLVYEAENNNTDISDLVLRKLGVTPAPKK